jgi:hypothetical protein
LKKIIVLCLLVWAVPLMIHAFDCRKGPVSGPNPPENMDQGLREVSKSQVILPGVPSYIWHHGAVPTAVGMVLGYYDGMDCPDLFPGDASIQTEYVNSLIAGDNGDTDCGAAYSDHYHDYACPIDTPEDIIADKSQLGGAHQNNCFADFSTTSFSYSNCAYGETPVG